jgi:hypothetical protein
MQMPLERRSETASHNANPQRFRRAAFPDERLGRSILRGGRRCGSRQEIAPREV